MSPEKDIHIQLRSLSLSLVGHHHSPELCHSNQRTKDMATSGCIAFSVKRWEPELVAPAADTPHELKHLSDIDDQEGLRMQFTVIELYERREGNGGDPAAVVRDALARALVHYYPLAGRLREMEGRKLVVDCTGEGVMFVEADADVTLRRLAGETSLQPPFPYLDDVLLDVPGSGGVLNCPLLLVQVTRLKCGGFIVALRQNHAMCDAAGLVQFMSAVCEMARGDHTPSVKPVWERHLLSARDPPQVTCTHKEYEHVPDPNGTLVPLPLDQMVHRSFTFGPAEVTALRRRFAVPPSDRCSAFELLAACLWRCRTAALRPSPDVEVRLLCVVNARGRMLDPPLPVGYYGNAFAISPAVCSAGSLCGSPPTHALRLVRRAKAAVTEEYMRSLADLLATSGRPHIEVAGSFLLSDLTKAGFDKVDLGWGMPVYGGPAKGGVESFPGVVSLVFRKEGEIVVPICLPAPVMERFQRELDAMLKGDDGGDSGYIMTKEDKFMVTSPFTSSAL